MEELIKEEKIENMIYEIRGKQVMLDSDLAILYQVETKRINESVKRNKVKFPNRFCFNISENDYNLLKSQFATSKGGSRKGHYVFTEQGIAMLATILKSKVATKVSINIMDAFVTMRHYIGNNEYRLSNIETKIIEHDKNIKLLQDSFDKMDELKEVNEMYFNGKIYDAYSKVLDIFKEANKELIIIDRFTDKTILDMIKNIDCNVILITSDRTKLTKIDIEKYIEDYDNLKIYYDDTFHDRYFIIDKEKIYHSGNSINHIGYRKSSIDVIGDESVKKSIMNDVEKIIY